MTENFSVNIFINCPFDEKYKRLFRPLVFTCLFCGLEPQIANTSDSAKARLEQIIEKITQSKYSIHDLSRMTLSEATNLPRFNMPFELGIEFGVRVCDTQLQAKRCLVIDQDPYRYKAAISDLAGFDIENYGIQLEPQAENVVKVLRNWFTRALNPQQPNWRSIWYGFNEFIHDLTAIIQAEFPDTQINELTEAEFLFYAKEWVQAQPIS